MKVWLVTVAFMTINIQVAQIHNLFFFRNCYETRGDPRLPQVQWWGRRLCPPRTLIVMGNQRRAFAKLMPLLPPCEVKSGSWVILPISSSLQRMHNTSCCCCISGEDGEWGGWVVCLWLLWGFPSRKVTKLSSPCHLPSLSQSLPLTRGAGGITAKIDNEEWRRRGRWKTSGGAVQHLKSGMEHISRCVHVLISPIGADDAHKAKNNGNPQRWHSSACLSR